MVRGSAASLNRSRDTYACMSVPCARRRRASVETARAGQGHDPATSPSAPVSRRAPSRTRSTAGRASRTTRATASSRSPDELGWYPNRAARALSAARADACGLVLARPARTLALEPFFMEFIAGVESELSARSIALTIQLVRTSRRRSRSTAAGGASIASTACSMVDLRVDDPRVDELVRLGLPAVVVGGPLENRALPAVWHDEASRRRRRRSQYLAALGHTRIAHVTGVARVRAHACSGSTAFESAIARARARGRDRRDGLQRRAGRARDAQAALVAGAADARSSSTATCSRSPGLGVAQQMGFAVPDDLSIVGWDDSLISQVVHPPLTAITRDITAYGDHGRAAPARRDRGAAPRRRRDGPRRAHAARQHRPRSRRPSR